MLKSRGKNSTSFLNSRKAKRVLSAFYFWIVASKFQEMGGVLDFVPCNFIFFPCNCFFVRWNFYFLGRFFDYMQWFLHESAQFSSERREIPKKISRFSAKTSRSCEIQKLWVSNNSEQLFWSCKWRVKLGGQNDQSFLSTDGLPLILFSTSVSIDWTVQAKEHLTIKPNISPHHTFLSTK